MIFETFARRKQKQARNGEPEVYTYDDAPAHLRHQICLALQEGIGGYHVVTGNEFSVPPNCNDVWDGIDRICRKEIFLYSHHATSNNVASRYLTYLSAAGMDDFLSAVEIGCLGLSCINDESNGMHKRGAKQTGVESIEEINGRFEGDGASELVTKVSAKGLFTHDFDRSFTAYVAMLKAGLPAVRNDAGGHGEGLAAPAVTAQIARFALNLTASNILFLGESYVAIKRSGTS